MTAPRPAKVLIAISNPSDYPPLDVENEVRRISEPLDKLNGDVRYEIIRQATKRDFAEKLLVFKPHVVHFIGHGTIKPNGEGALVFEDIVHSKSALMSADEMMQLLRSARSVQVVILNACLTAAETAGKAIMAIAPRLVWAGMPIVIAMQVAVPDKTAVVFSQDLYKSLSRGVPLDAAITQARLLTYLENKVAWGIPVLFMRAPDGVIWEPRT